MTKTTFAKFAFSAVLALAASAVSASMAVPMCTPVVTGLRSDLSSGSYPGFDLRSYNATRLVDLTSTGGATTTMVQTGGSSADPNDQQVLTAWTNSTFKFFFPKTTTTQGYWQYNGTNRGTVTMLQSAYPQRFQVTFDSFAATLWNATSFTATCR